MNEFKPGIIGDDDEIKIGEEHVTPANRKGSQNAPAGKWVDVPRGMVVAPGTYVDEAGVLRSVSDDSCVVWHDVWYEDVPPNPLISGSVWSRLRRSCNRTGIRPSEIVYDPETGAPWCDKCWERKEKELEAKKILDEELTEWKTWWKNESR